MAGAVTLLPQKRMNRTISRLPGVRRSVRGQGEDIADVANSRLALHRQDYVAKIEVTQGTTDALVSLVDVAALSIEFGHYLGPRGAENRRYVEGLHLFRGYRFSDGVV